MGGCTMKPVIGEQRLVHLDVLRGFALLGILLVNFEWFTRPVEAMLLGADPALTGMDRMVDWAIRCLAEGKFYPMFSMLFGAGFALMVERAREQEASFWQIYLRRILVLGLFGALHIALFWSGDILLVYAFSALVMVLFFRKTPLARLWKWALALIVVPLLLAWLILGLISLAHLDPETSAELTADFDAGRAMVLDDIERATAIHMHGGFWENVDERLRSFRVLVASSGFVWVPFVIGFFLLGRWLIVSGRLTQVKVHTEVFRRWRLYGLVLGLALAIGSTVLLYDADMTTVSLQVTLGFTLGTAASVVLTLGYLSTIVLASGRLQWLAPAGRMALTHYLLQSVVWTTVFYGYGLGLWGQIPRAWHPLLVVLFFTLQIVFSHWWLSRFRFGPVEWLWRTLTYWQIQPMRRVP